MLSVKSGFRSVGRAAIPGAHILTDVATENPIANFFAQLQGNIILEFDGEIRDATTRIDGAIRQDAIGGAGLNATRASAAVTGDEWCIGFEFEIEQDF